MTEPDAAQAANAHATARRVGRPRGLPSRPTDAAAEELEELTHRLAADWLAYRHQRWPASVNPHLLVSQKTALDTTRP
ncbi:hypothetical protein OOK27_11825 [Streptomyces canus]|uniref:hypothetical protein n=1 Tax=Streptomyces canus TaxID=58343 RepID=UPI002257D862|nr:hypothetical protein [Streptomyces canus]MCX5254854.1 hypothetical protein [Streptomyces canus]